MSHSQRWCWVVSQAAPQRLHRGLSARLARKSRAAVHAPQIGLPNTQTSAMSWGANVAFVFKFSTPTDAIQRVSMQKGSSGKDVQYSALFCAKKMRATHTAIRPMSNQEYYAILRPKFTKCYYKGNSDLWKFNFNLPKITHLPKPML